MGTNISLNLFGPLSQQHGQWLGELVEQVAPFCEIPEFAGTIDFFVAPKEFFPELINQISEAGEYRPGFHVPLAVTVPHLVKRELKCFVLLDSELMEGVEEGGRPARLVSAVLEELLHVKVYATRWNRFGRLDLTADTPRQESIVSTARAIHDEYIVCRRKAELASTLPIFDAPGQPGARTTRVLAYGDSVLKRLEEADIAIARLSSQVPRHEYMSRVALIEELNILYRRVFEPLARERGFRDAAAVGGLSNLPDYCA